MNQFYVPYKLSLKLKKAGFKEETYAFYNQKGKGKDLYFSSGFYDTSNWNQDEKGLDSLVSAPMYQQVVDWLREKHDLIVEARYVGYGDDKQYFEAEVYIKDFDGEPGEECKK